MPVWLWQNPLDQNSAPPVDSTVAVQSLHQFVPARHAAITRHRHPVRNAATCFDEEYLNEKQPGAKTVLIFSDLKEDLPEGYVRDIELDLNGFEIVALNVTKLRSDNVDPREYLSRLENWQTRVENSGGEWRVINDLDGLEGLL